MASAPSRGRSLRGVTTVRVAGVVLALLSLASAAWRLVGVGAGDIRPDHDPLMEPALWLAAGAVAMAMLLGFSPGPRIHLVGFAACAFVVLLGVLVADALAWSLVSVVPLLLASGCARAFAPRGT